ncbi:alpha/beta-hydrolase [Trametes cingulata]|nr:alpha/beta-hydrolase [Trametes cingulata]
MDPALSCSFMEVPLDYHDRSAGYGHLALIKANATHARRGTIFYNPGGPGGSGLQALDSFSATALALTGGHYDIVSWDPRGVGPLTIPGDISCFPTLADYTAFWNGTIQLTGIETTGNFTSAADLGALFGQAPLMQAKFDELARRCLRSPSGRFLRYVGTAATARDVVAMADALDGPGSAVNFIGVSYGTLLGTWLVNMFPERVGRVVLDGVISPVAVATDESSVVWSNHELADADKVYEGFVTGCALAGPQGCAIAASAGLSPADVDESIRALLQRAHDAARRNQSVPVTSSDIRELLGSAMYDPADWAGFANTTWAELVAAVDGEVGMKGGRRRTDDAFRPQTPRDDPTEDTQPDGGVAILCGDSVDPRGTRVEDAFKTIVTASRNVSPLFASIWPASFYYCPFWPVRAVERYQGPFNRTLANRILVLSNLFDPATPLEGAKEVATLLGDSAVLVTQRGFGHTTFTEPSQCLSDILTAYFTYGTMPESNGTTCAADADFEVFPGVNTEAILAAMSA